MARVSWLYGRTESTVHVVHAIDGLEVVFDSHVRQIGVFAMPRERERAPWLSRCGRQVAFVPH